MLIGTASLMVLGIQPVLLGALTQEGRIGEAAMGWLATVEVLALAIGSALGVRVLRKGPIAVKVALGCVLLACANAAIYVAHDLAMLFLTRGIAGLLEGFVLGAAIVVITHSRAPDRLNGLFLALQTIPQAALAYALPVTILPRFGADGGFAILAALAAVSAISAFALTERHPPAPEATHASSHPWRLPVIGVLVAVTLQNAAIGGAWAYAERMAVQYRLPPDLYGAALSASLMFQVAGAFAVAWFAWRLPFRIVTVAGPLCQAAVILAIATMPGLYVPATAVFGLFWLALSPYQVRLLIDMDPTRQAVLVATAITLFGLSAGPSLSALGVASGDVRGAFWIAGGLMLASAVTFAVSSRARAPAVRPAPG